MVVGYLRNTHLFTKSDNLYYFNNIFMYYFKMQYGSVKVQSGVN